MTRRCLLWGSGKAFQDYYHTIKYYELLEKIIVCGVTSDDSLRSKIGDYRLIEKGDIKDEDYDVVVIMSTTKTIIKSIIKEAVSIGIDSYKIVPCQVMSLIGFDFDKYREIRKNPPTIFAPNCWGGVTYNKLCLRFDSPFINMFVRPDDYIKFLANPKHYLGCELQFREMQWENILKRDFPVAECDDILLNFNHYVSFDDANDAWKRRKERINWNNLFVMFYDEDMERVMRFCEMPYEKKVCFVPYQFNSSCVLPIEYRINEKMREVPFWEIVNGMANGKWLYYDVFNLLLYNKFVSIAEFRSENIKL